MCAISSDTYALLATAGQINWHDEESMTQNASPLLAQLAKPDILRDLVDNLKKTPKYWDMCEQEYGFRKFVLYVDEEDRFRLRLHVMRAAAEETPHSHRMNFVTHLLNGSYIHRLYMPEDNGVDLVAPDQIRCVVRHQVDTGKGYGIEHSVVHSLQVIEEPCVSLMMRGNIVKDRALNIDIANKEVWWQHGDQHPAYHTSSKLDMPGELDKLKALLRDLSLV